MLKPQDVILAVKLFCKGKDDWSQAVLSQELVISVSEINAGLKRLSAAKLVEQHNDGRRWVVIRNAFKEFLLHGIKYVFPAVKSGPAVGLVTAYHHIDYQSHFNEQPLVAVWPDAKAKTKGFAIEPLYPTVSSAAKNDPELYSWLALIDCLRDRDNEELSVAEVLLREKITRKRKRSSEAIALVVEKNVDHDQQLDLLSL